MTNREERIPLHAFLKTKNENKNTFCEKTFYYNFFKKADIVV